jgi:hypothetical protein
VAARSSRGAPARPEYGDAGGGRRGANQQRDDALAAVAEVAVGEPAAADAVQDMGVGRRDGDVDGGRAEQQP